MEDVDAQGLLRGIGIAKTRGDDAETLVQSRSAYAQLMGAALLAYTTELQKSRFIDMDDMIALPVRLLEGDPQLCELYQARYRHLLVDEYQDTNSLQHRLITCLLGPEGNLCVVGDDDQSIYAFRGHSLVLNHCP